MFLYNENQTMKILGCQYPLQLLAGDGIAAKDFKNVINAHRKNKTSSFWEFGVDMFMLGYIYGKRAERKKRKVT